MRKIIFLSVVYLCILNNSFSQGFNWITPNKTYLKLSVNSDGIYRINPVDFTNAGINPGTIDPRTIKVLHKGNQIPVYFQGEDDGSFDANDFFDFYGKRNYGGPTVHRNGFTNAAVYTIDEYYDLYSDTNVYWVDWGGKKGLRMQQSNFTAPDNYPFNSYYKRVHFEQNNFYYLGETTNPNNDYRYFSNEIVVGEGWFWSGLTTEQQLDDTLTINDLSSTPGLCSLKLFVKPVSYTDSVFNEQRLEIKINGVVYDTLYRNNLERFDTTITFPSSMLQNGSVNTVTIRYIPLGNQFFYPVVFVDFFDLIYPRDFAIRGSSMFIDLNASDSTSRKVTLTGYSPGSELNIYDIKNFIRITGIPDGGNLVFTGKSNSSFMFVNQTITKKPFKIISRQVPDLISGNNAADYLLLYPKKFESQAEQLRSHRQNHDNYRSFKAEITDIYDIFNYGIENPSAVRSFIKYAYDNWQSPKVGYVCMLGRASLDPKKNAPGSTFYENLLPTYGNPPTDGYFVNFNMGTYTYYHQVSIGRLPVYTVTEAQDAVNKIINYDQIQPDRWWKNYIAITGGGTRPEQLNFQGKSETLINNYIKNIPASMNVARIYRNDSAGYITYNYKDSIKKEIDRGALMINFIGHAASQDWEIGLENPNTLNNGMKLPFVLSFTCYTGKNSEANFRGFGENFFTPPSKCAIGFLGSTGWSFSGIGDTYNDYVVRAFARDSIRRLGEMITVASKRMSSDSGNFNARNTINCYNLIGDPATYILMPNTPEFDIKPTDVKLSNSFPAIGEIIKVSAFPKNLGYYVDSVKIKFQIRKNGVQSQRKDTVIRSFGKIDTVDYFFQIDSLGSYTVSIVVDPDRTYPQKYTGNDSVTFPLTLRNLSYVGIKPLDNTLLQSNTFTFTGLNPNVNPLKNTVKIILQVDTSRSFDSPVLLTYNNSNVTGVTSNFNVTIPVTQENTLYYMRTNAIVNNDSTGWSTVQRIIYRTDNGGKLTGSDSAYTIYTDKPGQYDESGIVNINYNGDGFVLNEYTGNLSIRSFGSNGNEASYFLINNYSYYSDGGNNIGMNIAKVRKYNGLIKEIKNFRLNSPSSSDSVLTFLNSFDTTDYMMAYIAYYVEADSLRLDARDKFREFGVRYLDSVALNFFDSWAFFGYLGADSTQTCETYHRFFSNNAAEPSNCQINPSFHNTSGYITMNAGPADQWRSFSWMQEIAKNSKIEFDVLGLDRDNVPVMLYSGLTGNELVNIDTVNSYTYPNIRLNTKLSIDSVNGFDSPVFKSTTLKYVPPAELIPDNNSFTGSDTLVQEGDSVRFSVNYYNVGYIEAPQIINKWYIKRKTGDVVLKQDTINEPLKVDSMSSSAIVFSTAGLRDPKLERDTIDIYFETNLTGNKNELFGYNNTAIGKFVVEGDTISPTMEVTYDGVRILNGDFIPSTPNIVLKFYDDSRMVINDTGNVKVYSFINNVYVYVPYYVNGMKNPEIDINFPEANFLQAIVTYKPTLTPGEHKFKYVAVDQTGNRADTVLNTVIVDDELHIYDMANYPNPMRNETDFMFRLSGEFAPTSCKIKIYTVAGRLIKEINANAMIGYNVVHWDGRDDDGDAISNGVYLYKFIIQGDSQIETSIQKLAVLK